MTDPIPPGSSGSIHFSSPRSPAPAAQQPPLPGTPWSVSLWDGTRPLAVIPLEVVEDVGQRITFKGRNAVLAAILGIVRQVKIHSPRGEEYGPFPCGLTSEAKSLPPGTLTWDNVVICPGSQLAFGGVTLSWTGTT